MKQSSPPQSPRGIDHLVLAGANLDALADFYARLGFQVGPRNRHPWGTENHIIQFDGAFLELIGVGRGAAIAERAGRAYSFGAFVRDFCQGGEGLAMLALDSRNAVGDAEAFRQARIGTFDPFHFEREGRDAAGQPKVVSFSLAFAEMHNAPRAGFFTCQQHKPQNFWAAEKQVHANGVTAIAEVVMVDDDPADHHEFLGAFIGQRVMRSVSGALEIETARGRLTVLSPAAFRFRFGVAPPLKAGAGPQFAAVTFRCVRGQAMAARLATVAPCALQHGGMLVLPGTNAHGVVLAFAES